MEMVNRFAVQVVAPSPVCHVLDDLEQALLFLLHDDGLQLLPIKTDLIEQISNPELWSKCADGRPFQFKVQQGFSAAVITRIDVEPTLHVSRCAWCDESHLGGPEYCGSTLLGNVAE